MSTDAQRILEAIRSFPEFEPRDSPWVSWREGCDIVELDGEFDMAALAEHIANELERGEGKA